MEPGTEQKKEQELATQDFEITGLPESGYHPLVDYESWRVAVLKYCSDVQLENLTNMQKHMQSDEVFVLLSGACTLYAAGEGESPAAIRKIPLEPCKLYNVKRGHWHTHALSCDGAVLIVENRDTCDDNSPIHQLSEQQRKELIELSM